MNRADIRFVRTDRRIIESAQVEIGTSNGRDLEDPDGDPKIYLRATVVDYDDRNWAMGVARPNRRTIKLELREDGSFTWRGAPFSASNGDEIARKAREALRSYFQ